MPLLKMLRQFAGYLLCATLLLSPGGWVLGGETTVWLSIRDGVLYLSPIAIWFWLCFIGALFRIQYCFTQWYSLDVLACSLIHGTRLRTISGWTGEHAHKKRYRYAAKVIDWLAVKVGDKPNHCHRIYLSELRMGLVK